MNSEAEIKLSRDGDSEMACKVKALAVKPDDSDHWDLHGEWREPTPTSCPPISMHQQSIHVHVSVHAYTMNTCNEKFKGERKCEELPL